MVVNCRRCLRYNSAMHITTSVPPRKLMILEGVGAAAHLVQGRSLLVPRLYIDHATVVLVLAGKKTIYSEAGNCVCDAGDILLLPPGASYGVLNEVDNNGRAYEAIALSVDQALIAQVASSSPASLPLTQARTLPRVETGFRQALLRVNQLMQEHTTPAPIVRHAMMEVLTWMQLAGVHFAPVKPPSSVDSLRVLLARAPDQPWTSMEAARLLNMSEATLRRRLAREHWTMGTLLQEVRLTYAMMLLQAGDTYVGQIALDAGFTNHAHFSRLFKNRFGITPTQLRQPEHPVARAQTDAVFI